MAVTRGSAVPFICMNSALSGGPDVGKESNVAVLPDWLVKVML